MIKGKKKKKEKITGKAANFFCLGVALRGTTPAVVKVKTLKQAFWVYTHAVIVPAKRTQEHTFNPENIIISGRMYYDGHVYIERLKLWKKIKGCPISAIALDMEIVELKKAKVQFDSGLE